MGITDEQKAKSGKSKPPLLPKPCISSPAGSGEHVIPQMVITSADDVPEELQDGSEATTVPVSASIEAESADIHVEEEAKNESIEAVHQRPLTIGACEGIPIDSIPNTPEATSPESPIHSTAQRPLIFESEKSLSHIDNSGLETDLNCSSLPTSSPQMAAPTTLQRPLIFDGSGSQSEIMANTNTETGVTGADYTQEMSTGEKSASIPHVIEQQETEFITSTDKPKKDNFSWIPNFPKIHASTKEAKLGDDDHVKKDHSNSQKDDKAHSKKDGMHGVKKFFDSFRQDHETKDNSEKLGKDVLLSESAREEHKERHGLKNLFGFSKPDCEVNEKVIPSKDSKIPNKDHKDIKDNVKHFFDSFKHDAANQKHIPMLQDEIVQPSDTETARKTHSKESKH